MVGKDGSVTIEAAAELMNLDIRTLRQWTAIGSLQVERRGEIELVHLGQVQSLARSPLGGTHQHSRRGALRGLLREAAAVDTRSVAGLQELARERSASIP